MVQRRLTATPFPTDLRTLNQYGGFDSTFDDRASGISDVVLAVDKHEHRGSDALANK